MKSLRMFPAILLAVIMSLSLQFALGCTSSIPDPVPAEDPYAASADTPEPSDAAEVKTSNATEPSEKLPCVVIPMISGELSEYVSAEVEEDKAGTRKTVDFAGKEYRLEYKETRRYILGDKTYDDYTIIGDEGSLVRLCPDDSFAVVFPKDPILVLDAKWDDSEDKIRSAVEEALGNETDFGRYERCITEEKVQTSTVWSYKFSWTNCYNGIRMDDFCSVTVYNGAVTHVLIKRVDLCTDKLPAALSINDYVPDINGKLQEVYGDSLKSSVINSYYLTTVDGLPSIYCSVGVEYDEEGSSVPMSEGIGVVVQLQTEP